VNVSEAFMEIARQAMADVADTTNTDNVGVDGSKGGAKKGCC
jgi:hypothetical protein